MEEGLNQVWEEAIMSLIEICTALVKKNLRLRETKLRTWNVETLMDSLLDTGTSSKLEFIIGYKYNSLFLYKIPN